MNTEISENEAETPESPPEPTEVREEQPAPAPARRRGSALSFFALIFSLAALAGTGWMWWQDQSSSGQQQVYSEIARLEGSDSALSLKLDQVRDEMNTLAAGDVGAEFKAMQERLAADRVKLQSVERSVSEQQNLSRSLQAAAESMQVRLVAAEAALGGVAARELDARDELDIAEVDYLLRLASERLQLFSDPDAADKALEVADMHLAALDNPMYLGVRQDISAARRELAGLSIPDYLQITSQLDSIQQSIPSLAFRGETEAVSGDVAPVEGKSWWEKMKSVFSGLVTVRRSTEEEGERISLQDKDFIRQRVWLQLEVAHLALMRRDQEAFANALERVRETMSYWFDQETDAYAEVVRSMDGLMRLEIQVDAPDISAPWATLKLLRTSQAVRNAVPDSAQAAPETSGEPEEQQE